MMKSSIYSGQQSSSNNQSTLDAFLVKRKLPAAKRPADSSADTCLTAPKPHCEGKITSNNENRAANALQLVECMELEGKTDAKLKKQKSHQLPPEYPSIGDILEEDARNWIARLGFEWYEVLKDELSKQYFQQCLEKVEKERQTKRVYPPDNLVFNAFKLAALPDIKVVIIGQDPYHQPGQAMGLSFSVPRGVVCPPSLKNIFKEIGIHSSHGDLTSWAKQGVFLLNSLLTVVESTPMAHKAMGWEKFTDFIVETINLKCEAVVFLLWGLHPVAKYSLFRENRKPAQKKASHVNRNKHYVLSCGHPSPLSVRFFEGCQHFKKCNDILRSLNKVEIDWNLPE